MTVGIQGNMSVVQNMSGIIATEVGCRLGVAMQNAANSGPPHAGGTNSSEDANLTPKTKSPPYWGFMGQ
jgi:hypothetical protein